MYDVETNTLFIPQKEIVMQDELLPYTDLSLNLPTQHSTCGLGD